MVIIVHEHHSSVPSSSFPLILQPGPASFRSLLCPSSDDDDDDDGDGDDGDDDDDDEEEEEQEEKDEPGTPSNFLRQLCETLHSGMFFSGLPVSATGVSAVSRR